MYSLFCVCVQGSDEQLTMDLLEKYMMEKTFIAYMFCLVACITSLFATKETHKKRYVVIYVLICSMTGSITVMCVKGVSTALILTFEGHNQFIYFVPWMLLGKTKCTKSQACSLFPAGPLSPNPPRNLTFDSQQSHAPSESITTVIGPKHLT